jgi:Zn-dependent peptidase ImmA (M78 family)
MTEVEIKQKANDVETVSQYYHLTHAVVARVVKTDNKLVISIPGGLLDDVHSTNMQIVQAAVSSIRFLMAHELGHICLHTDKIQRDLVGSLALGDDAEREADVFARELLRLRDERNKKLYNRA